MQNYKVFLIVLTVFWRVIPEDLPSNALAFVLSDGRVNGYFGKSHKSQRKLNGF